MINGSPTRAGRLASGWRPTERRQAADLLATGAASAARPDRSGRPCWSFRRRDSSIRGCYLAYHWQVVKYGFTEYFDKEVLRKRPYLKKEWCIRVVEHPIRSESQENNRYRFWAEIPELEGRFLRVITLADKVTIHNAFPDRRFKR